MSKTVTLRLSNDEYRIISSRAQIEHRPISNLITSLVMKTIEEAMCVDSIEMDQIRSDKQLLRKLAKAHDAAGKKKGKLLG
jgi:uncharacterized protein (DUF1778 family)